MVELDKCWTVPYDDSCRQQGRHLIDRGNMDTPESFAARLTEITGNYWRVIPTGGGCSATESVGLPGWRVQLTSDATAPVFGETVTATFFADGDTDPQHTDTADTVRGVFALMITTANRYGWQWADYWA